VSTGAGSLKCPSCAKSRRAFRQEETRSLPRASRNLKCRQTHAARRVRDFSPERSLPLTTARFAGSETIALIVPDLFRTLTVYRNRGQITSPICGVWAALGIEALERFVRQEPLRRVHECVFGVLALESEPVDPRL